MVDFQTIFWMDMETCKMKILVISLSGIGDTLCITPLIKEIRKNYPDSVIDVLVMWKGSEDILKNNPHIDKIYKFNMIKEGFAKSLLFCLKLRNKNYDISINSYPQSKREYRMVSWLIGAKNRVSHIYDNYNFLDSLLINKSIMQDYGLHFIDNNLKLLNLLDKKIKIKKQNYELFFSDENLKYANNFITNNKLKNNILFGIHTGSSSTKNLSLRRWPSEHYEALIKKILKENKRTSILLFGGPDEMKENEILNNRIKNDRLFLVRTENIMDSAAILKKCNVFLSVDTVMMHLATAVKVPIQVVIQSPTYNLTVRPYRKDFILIGNAPPKDIYYLYDGKGIHGKKEDILNYMKNINPEQIYKIINKYIK